MFNRYNIYHAMLRAVPGEGTGGAADDVTDAEAAAAASANAKTINADDVEDPAPASVEKTAEQIAAEAAAADAGDDDVEDKTPEQIAAEAAAKPKSVIPREIMVRRVGELTRDKRTLEAQLEEANRKLAEKTQGDAGDDVDASPKRKDYRTQAEFDVAVQQEAARQRQIEVFNTQCDTVADEGEKTYGKDGWAESVANLRVLSDDGNIPMPLLDAVLASDDPAKALHHLGQNPEEAERILRLPPIQRVAAVIKHGLKTPTARPKPRTNTPAPIDPIGGDGGASGDDGLSDKVDDATWLANRQKQVDAKAGIRNR